MLHLTITCAHQGLRERAWCALRTHEDCGADNLCQVIQSSHAFRAEAGTMLLNRDDCGADHLRLIVIEIKALRGPAAKKLLAHPRLAPIDLLCVIQSVDSLADEAARILLDHAECAASHVRQLMQWLPRPSASIRAHAKRTARACEARDALLRKLAKADAHEPLRAERPLHAVRAA